MRNAPSSAALVSSVFSAASCGITGIFRSAAFASARRHFFQFCNTERLCDRLRQSAFKLRLRHGAQLIDAFAQCRTVAVSALRAVEKRFQLRFEHVELLLRHRHAVFAVRELFYNVVHRFDLLFLLRFFKARRKSLHHARRALCRHCHE